MNSKKNKKVANQTEMWQDGSNVENKNIKKNKSEITNENNLKRKKRKLYDPDSGVDLKKFKSDLNNSITVNENNTELSAVNDNIENNIPTTKFSKRKSSEDSFGKLVDPEVLRQISDVTKKGKKKKNNKQDVESIEDDAERDMDPGEGVSNTNSPNQLSPQLLHEVAQVNVKEQTINEEIENVITISIKDDSKWDENHLLKQLEQKMEKKDIAKEKKVTIEWPEVDLIELVERMEVGLPENDLKPYIKRTEELEWDKIAFKNYSVEDCKKTWSLLLKKIRRYRILAEVLHDAKKWIATPRLKKKTSKVQRHPDMPRRPLSAYFIYYLKKKDELHAEHPGIDATELAKLCSQKFKLLPPEKMTKYEKIAKKNKEEYDQKMKEFYEIHPELKVSKDTKGKKVKTPKCPKPIKEKPPPKPPKGKVPKRPLSAYQYFQLAEMKKQELDDKVAYKEVCRERWKEMPDDKKMEWITFAEAENVKYEEDMREYIKNHPEYVNNAQKPQLSKEDLHVKERVSGKPPKPPVSAYNLFSRIMLHSEDIKQVPVKDRLVFVSNQWKECTEEEKKHYKELFDKTIEKYNQDLATYLESLPEEERKLELLKIQPKRRKSDEEKRKKSKPKKAAKKKAEKKPNKVEKKVVEKVEKKPKKLVEPAQPPISPYKYFCSLHEGTVPAVKAWKLLSSEEKKKYEDELVQKKKAYILDFEKFLKSMTKEELESFSNSRKKLHDQLEGDGDDDDDDEGETSDSDSDESDE